mgnify:FL=1|jgi:hypothetical protein
MFKNLDLNNDATIKSFKSFKNFTFTNNDSGSGVFAIKARTGSLYNYVSSSDEIITITNDSTSTNFFAFPTYVMLNNLYYSKHGREYVRSGSMNRNLHSSASVISVARDLFGEKIKPNSIELTANVGGETFTIKDDGEGNLYDNAFSSSFVTYKANLFQSGSSTTTATRGSGSEVGNIFYEQGLLVFTDTGSYKDVGFGTSYTLKYQSTQTHYEYEYRVSAKPFEFNTSTNISLTPDRSGSQTISQGVVSMSNFFPPSHLPTGQGTGSYATFYNAATESLGIVTGSEFQPFVTDIGLYSENNELLAHGKLAKPVKLSKDIETTFVVRFDV